MNLVKKLGWFFKLERRRYLIGIISLSLVAVFNLIPPRVMGAVVDRINSGELGRDELWFNIFLLLGSGFIMYLLRYVWRKYILGTSNHLARILRFRLFEHFTKMSPSFYQKYRTGDLMAHATNDINAVTQTAGGGVMSAVDASITALVTLLTMFIVIDWRLTVVAILPLPFMALATSLLGRKNHETFKEAQEAFSDLNNKVQESVAGIKVTKSFGYQENEKESFAQTNQTVYEKNVVSARYNSLFSPLVLTFVGLSYLLTLIVGTVLITQNALTIGELITFVTYLDMLVWPLMAMGFLFNVIQRGSVSYERIENLLSQESDIQETAQPIEHIENGRLSYHIKQFAYDDRVTLHDVHVELEKGQTLGIVGVTGSGKTTLLKLLLRERDVQEGSISINGHDIRDYRLKDLRSLIGYVPQDQMLFATTIRENVRFADPKFSDQAVARATQLCGVYDDIMDMPEQFDTIIGERGVSLSGGQKQRLALSRALIMEPDILILDDSLSAVDAKTEHFILENLKSERSGKTTIITAHRLSAIVHADVIIVMEDGTIKERGTHDTLMAKKGWYYENYQSQQLAQDLEGELDGN
ncbi:ABC transporter ATP-binding protein [Streptococcus merionis]|uniref:ABC transporter permease/ATPase n=1 Tax=Streptococcus merionis TaxID=400065 RepID=A0A239ST77_9STRE|nr:ABC transporter transmembrane domain-containing protein [Streptococcus merionis]SNU88617.1 ABC transporter permease/ATPase [Streptococcus merionis]